MADDDVVVLVVDLVEASEVIVRADVREQLATRIAAAIDELRQQHRIGPPLARRELVADRVG